MILFSPAAVISVHGIRTKGEWQNTLSGILEEKQMEYAPYKFGYYNIFRFLFNPSNEKMVDNFYEFYSRIATDKKFDIDVDHYAKRPSIVAHSFGSYIVGYCMLKYPDVKFDKMILCGSILPQDFDWPALFIRNQVNLVINEFGFQDIWARIVGRLVKNTGDSGMHGFSTKSPRLREQRFDYFGHSDYFKGQHIEKHWIPVLQKAPNPFYIRQGTDFETYESLKEILDITGDVIDKECYGNLAHYDEVEIPENLAEEWVRINPNIYTFLFSQEDNTVKGYINAMPLNEDIFKKIKDGKIQDNEITSDDIVPFVNNQEVCIYFMSIAIDPDARTACEGLIHAGLDKLINGLTDKLMQYYRRDKIKVKEFLATGWTPEGRKLCKLIGMKQIAQDKYQNPVYYVDVKNAGGASRSTLFYSFRKLIDTYNSR